MCLVEIVADSHVIFELTDLSSASPSAVARCALVHCPDDVISWMAIFESWSSMAKQRWVINTLSMQVLTGLVTSTFKQTLEFLRTKCSSAMTHNVSKMASADSRCAPGIAEVTNFLGVLSACLDNCFLREELERLAAEERAKEAAAAEAEAGARV